MSDLILYIANKNYSSWSFRPWIGLKAKDIAFEEKLVPFDDAAGNPEFKKFSPTGKVPVLIDGDLVIAESLAILDHVARKYPDAHLWPGDDKAKSQAMSICVEMVGGFPALRGQCPMNMRRPIKKMVQDAGLQKDVKRVETIWTECLARSGGPFLFGDFTIADAMYAPVVNRFEVYELTTHPACIDYMKNLKELSAWQVWEEAGRQEPWVVEKDEA